MLRNKKVRIALIIWALLLIIVIIIFLLLRRQEEQGQPLSVSEVVAVNIQRFNEVNPGPLNGEQAFFFTGSNLASFNVISEDTSDIETQSISKNGPVANVTDVSRSGSTVLFRASYSPGNEVLTNALGGSRPKGASDQAWYTSSDQSLQAAPFNNHRNVLDAMITNDGFVVIERAGSSQTLVTYGRDGQRTVLAPTTPAVSLIGLVDNFIASRNYSGEIFVWDGQSNRRVAEQTGETYFDSATKSVLFKSIEEHDIGEEGGQIVQGGEDDTATISVYSMAENSTKQIDTLYSYVYINGDGLIISTSGVAQPNQIAVTNIDTEEQARYDINQGASKISNQIAVVWQTSENPRLFMAITNNNLLTIWGEQKLVEGLQPHNYPGVPRLRDEYVFDYSVARNAVDIYAYEAYDNFISASTTSLREGCRCDVNQISKSWIVEEE